MLNNEELTGDHHYLLNWTFALEKGLRHSSEWKLVSIVQYVLVKVP